jgi:putative hydrolase of the HAD superfamily
VTGPVYSADVAPDVSAILLDAGGVLIFPAPELLAPPLRAAGVDADVSLLEQAHYQAMAAQDAAATPPVAGTWWHEYLLSYVGACGVAEVTRTLLVEEINRGLTGPAWTHVGTGVMDGLRAVAGLGLPMGVVSNSDGTVEAELARLGVCYADGSQTPAAGGIPMGVVLDSAVVGIAKPDPAIFRIALDALDIGADDTVLYVGDSLRYDVAGAQAAGLRPVHMDPYGFCRAPDGHAHVRSLADVAVLAAG